MTQPLLKLIDAGIPLNAPRPTGKDLLTVSSGLGLQGTQLAGLLLSKNGFYAFDSALLVRAVTSEESPLGLMQWNSHHLWKASYQVRRLPPFCFAEDVFGSQFCLIDDMVQTFDPETGEMESVCESLDQWAEMILNDCNYLTGYSLAREWQAQHGPLAPGTRLVPKVPFVCGGKFELQNLYALDDVSSMRLRATLANQISDLPDGATIDINVRREQS